MMPLYPFRPYVPVAKRRAKALRAVSKLKKKGKIISPINLEKRKITQTFWGNAWCQHIESFSDYANRLPRGRTYVRNGSVCHLAIDKGSVEAMVSGSSLYQVTINIKPLANNQWKSIKTYCTGEIDSLLDLLRGQLSKGVMQVVCDPHNGLFPSLEEIEMSCSCPDWAAMCKHVAAVLYGVGARLDKLPEQLFKLRSVDHSELIDASTIAIETDKKSQSHRHRIDHAAIPDMFGIDIMPPAPTKPTKSSHSPRRPKYLSGAAIRKKRKQLKLSQKTLGKRIGRSATTICRWESKGRYKLNLTEDIKAALQRLWQ